MTLVDEALSKICEIGTVGAMKWLHEAVVLAEREACAKVCMKQQCDLKTRQTFAAAIRARNTQQNQ